MSTAGRRWGWRQRVLMWVVLLAAWQSAWGQLRYSVPEEMPKGSFVGDVAKDLGLHLPALSDHGVRVVSEGRTQYFSLHGKTGHLVTAEKIDREQLCRLVEKCVLRCELIVEGEMQVYSIEVEISDINDNAPSFKEIELEESISEMTAVGARFPLAEAHDPDSGRNSLLTYDLKGDEHFSLAVQAGPGGDQRPELVLAKALDREEAAFHELVLRATDAGDPAWTGTARIHVLVLDVNDNAPVFSQSEYTVRVPEDVPVGYTLVTVTATDGDEGQYGHVKYSMKKATDMASGVFLLDSETGTITLVQSLDFEAADSHELEVQARDGGGLFDTAKVAITVTDVNDNMPEISVRSALSEISEDTPPGTVVALLHMQDQDSGANGEVRCSLDGGVPFRLHRSQGSYHRVVTTRELDREKVSEYNLTVRAVDGGSPSLQSSEMLALRVLDVNDNAPVFTQERYRARLAENNAAGALVLTVRATDADWGQNARVRYRLSEGRVRGLPLSSYFSSVFETVVWQQTLTSATQDRIFLYEEYEEKAKSESVIISQKLELEKWPHDEMLHICGRGSLVGPLARDLGLSPDELPARKLRVASAGKKQLKYFTLSEENGNLYVNERLDREELCGESASCSVSFEALVHKPLNVFHVEVVIQDVNDNTPTFRKAALELDIGEWIPPGTRFPLEMARDADVGSNSLLTYQLSSNPSFSLALKKSADGSQQPELVLERGLDREKQSSFELVLTALDGGEPARSGTIQVRVNVSDANDNRPVFSKSVYEARLAENLPAGSLILRVRATDADAGSNGQVSYSFGDVPDAVSTLFAVDSESGEVMTTGPLNFEETRKYRFDLEARDGGGLVSHCKVQIDVTDVNDNAPDITILSVSSPVPEDAPVGTVVALLNVNDLDSGENGQNGYRSGLCFREGV
ncbi:hypothetical protein WISP_77165 [Willisornis vidua]|uniref:Cadherin domain-containing protein n=1 Tax=Willisornis vidua TaxID=1566151 RepID=A0ABQ9D5V3_9PASS|nr:hypothetical protein WISP_77165 [Willisornis vidua]